MREVLLHGVLFESSSAAGSKGTSTPLRQTGVRKRITSLLAQQGWHVRGGRLVIGERVSVELGTVSPLGRDARLAALHADIRQVTERFVEDHLDVAIFEAFKAINNRVKQMAGLDLDGSQLGCR